MVGFHPTLAGFLPATSARMNMITGLFKSTIGITTLAFGIMAYAGGTDILHYSVQETLSNTGVETNATGNLNLTQDAQGKANKQSLSVQISGLTSNSDYILFAGILDTNVTAVTNFSTDDAGNATLDYGNVGKSQNKNKNRTALPDGLDPLRNVQALAIGTITTNFLSLNTNIVLYADLSTAEQFQYLVKRTIDTNGVSAGIRLKANAARAQFRLDAKGLNATNSYIFAVNDAFAQTVTPDSKGRLNFVSNPDPTQILSVHSVALWDSTSNVVIRTTLP